LASGQSDVRALFCKQVSDSRIRPTGCLFVYYFFEWVLGNHQPSALDTDICHLSNNHRAKRLAPHQTIAYHKNARESGHCDRQQTQTEKNMKKLILGALALLSMSWALATVNINTAGADELKALPGIGPAKAEAIVEYRKQHGNFKSVEELKNVKGIGDGIYNRLKDEATVSGAPAKKAQPAVKK
jgi:competence protein ComEA